MLCVRSVCVVVVCLLSLQWNSAAQSPLSLEDLLQLARVRGPQILAARDRIEESRARLRGASILFQSNPEFEFSAGPRRGEAVRTTDYDFGLGQSFELGGRRRARIAGARAAVSRDAAAARDSVRLLLREVSIAYYTALAAQERLRLLLQTEKAAADLQHSMERRFAAGDVAILEVNLARSTAARARADRRAAEADAASAIGDLRVSVGMRADEPITLAGDLRRPQQFDPEALIAYAERRPDVAVLEAEIGEAEAEASLGRGSRWPDLGFRISRERDEGDNVTKAGLSLTIPLFQRGQEQVATGEVKAGRLRRQLEALKHAIRVDVTTAIDIYRRRLAAVEDLERNALPTMSENEQLALRSYEEGEIGFAELLLIRRDAFETRIAYTDHLLEAALAAVNVEAHSGVLQ